MCGIVGEICTKSERVDMAKRIRGLLAAIQHRGHESAGISILMPNHRIKTKKAKGDVLEAIPSFWVVKRRGLAGLGQVRYSTTGTGASQKERKRSEKADPFLEDDEIIDPGLINSQPFYYDSENKGRISLVHNGNLTNAPKLRKELEKRGMKFETESDTEVIIRLICYYLRNPKLSMAQAIRKAMSKMKGAYSCILLSKNGLWAFRDPHGFRPLKIAKTKDSWIFASEPCAWHERETKPLKDRAHNVLSGEIVEVSIGNRELKSYLPKKKARRAFCIFEDVYLQAIFNLKVAQARFGFGEKLFLKFPLPGIVIPIMNSGEGAAMGYHFAQGKKFPGQAFYYPALYRNPKVGRTFLEPKQIDRIAKNKRKYFNLFKVPAPMIHELAKTEKDTWLIMIDDSLIRSNVSKTLIKVIRSILKKLFPKLYQRIKIAWLLSSPPYTHPCYFGIDTYEREQLIAANKDLEGIRRSIGADYLGYLPVKDMLEVAAKVHDLKTSDFCAACFTGKYPIKIDPTQDKMSLAANSA